MYTRISQWINYYARLIVKGKKYREMNKSIMLPKVQINRSLQLSLYEQYMNIWLPFFIE